MSAAHRRRQFHRGDGFTLVEMLVVLGIICVLMGILIPVVTAAKRQARKTACAARLRGIGQALQLFLSEHDDTIPQGCTSNSIDSPESRAGTSNLQFTSPQMLHGFVPPPNPDEKFLGPPGFRLPLAPIAYYLQKAAPVTEQVWSCPSIRNGSPGLFRTYQYVDRGARGQSGNNLTSEDSGPLAGTGGGAGEFRPGYQFMGGAEFWWSITSGKDETNRQKYQYDEFATRNIAGLRLDEIKPQGGQASAEVVSFADYSVMAHSKETDDMWQPDLWKQMGNYSANFLYLDGHVDYHEFHSCADYFKLLHRPIPQTWGSGKIQDSLNAPDVWSRQTTSP